MKKLLKSSHNSGQVLLLTVVALGGLLIGSTAIAGIVMVNAIRQLPQAENSAKAIYAADAGLEWELYKEFRNEGSLKPIFSNGADIETCSPKGGTDNKNCGDSKTIRSVGIVGGEDRKVRRAFELTFTRE